MSSIREQIADAAITQLETYDRPEGIPEPVRTRLISPKADQLPALTVYQGTEAADPMRDEKPERSSRGAVVRRALDLQIEAVVKAEAGGAAADSLVDPLYVWAVKALKAGGRLGGLANDSPDEVGLVFQYEQGEFHFCRAILTMRYLYQSNRNDPESLT